MDDSPRNVSRPRVLIVGTEALNLRIPLMDQLAEHGFDPCAAGARPQPEFDETPYDYFPYPICRTISFRGFCESVTSLREVIRAAGPDLVHAVNTKPCLIAPRAVRGLGIPCVRTVTGLGSAFSSDGLLYRGLRFAFRQMHHRVADDVVTTVFQNPDDRDYFVEAGLCVADRTRLILGSGIDIDQMRSAASSPKRLHELRTELDLHGRTVITMVSRLMRTKGVEELIDAAAAIRRRFPNAIFLLVGPLVESGPAALSAAAVTGNDSVKWIGLRDDVADLLSISDVFVLPSYLREGIPRVLFEAGAFKLPIVTTDMPGCRETVRDGWNGFLIPPRDSNAIVRALEPLLESPERRWQMGQNSLQLVRERFDLSIVSQSYADVYREALNMPVEHSLTRAA
ncbi:glycosyltransferase [bacterium]|nr:glycosyltransferase [bacterium]